MDFDDRFQSTRPVWGATISTGKVSDAQKFQSTRPVWGATGGATKQRGSKEFQSTRPVWGATCVFCDTQDASRVSIHAPRAGRDRGADLFDKLLRVSIHAPRAGRDFGCVVALLPKTSFNPRAPCGARRVSDTES